MTSTETTEPEDVRRRDFIYVMTGALAAVGGAATIWPLIDNMNPSADVIAAGAPEDVDVSAIPPGQQVTVTWRGRPIFIVHRTKEVLARLQDPALEERLADPQSRVFQQPPYATGRARAIRPEFLVLVGICTHLGCIPEFRPVEKARGLGPDWPGGYFCPCHGSRYDLSGRVYRSMPAPFNLAVPPYRFLDDNMLRIGENPPGSDFEFSSLEQV